MACGAGHGYTQTRSTSHVENTTLRSLPSARRAGLDLGLYVGFLFH